MTPTPLARSADLVVIGLPLRTSAETAAQDIPAHWQRFLGQPPSGDVYAVYCDYESDWRGPYTMVLGTAAAPDAVVPPGLRRVRVPAGRYASFDAAGDPRDVIWRAWLHINTEWPERGRRRYIADYERYPAGAPGSADVVVGVE